MLVDIPNLIAKSRDVWILLEGKRDEVEMLWDLKDDARAGVSSFEARWFGREARWV